MKTLNIDILETRLSNARTRLKIVEMLDNEVVAETTEKDPNILAALEVRDRLLAMDVTTIEAIFSKVACSNHNLIKALDGKVVKDILQVDAEEFPKATH